ncbi:DUF6778 family protein [Arenibacterium sp. CAU 1754]
MTRKSALALLVLGLGMAACSPAGMTTRDDQFVPVAVKSSEVIGLITNKTIADKPTVFTALSEKGVQVEPGKSPVTVTAVNVVVPRSLVVSEANSFLPVGDIVWREDIYGDRYEQVGGIMRNAMDKGVAELDGPVEVTLDIQVVKFHALTEKARYATGGVHAVSFLMAVKDAQTGELVIPVHNVRADLEAYGGQEALMAVSMGQTQRVRITDHLADVIREELTAPEGHENPDLGVIQAMNRM